ncbi:carboxymuconolactone decarboxylase family protein [Pseudooctadecabacter jejudonensis]|uniref:Carboxymuconolactone decarboxylase family protein n=1 Tax=Pseudooctadecabacter jejudonensis TaxID=1391910 RepID=A0A1Y5T8P9_9RHOB|nr:carboxymuconolactone decarboxylase family protein [Pseudooctadecabacter jejudonensis]SLN58429.1 Carboxymuconolactone decarboxylase family protein [Pseudooctadecabacter jejudonensis]
MSDQGTPFDAWMKAGQDWAKSLSPEFADVMAKSMKGVEDLMPTMPKDVMDTFMGKGINAEGLDAKTRLLLTLQGLVIQGAVAEPQIKLTVRHAIEAGATQIEITETIALAGMFGGAAGMPKALELAGEVFKKDTDT